jgi:inner membrane protein
LDNLTHTLVGVLVGETVARTTSSSDTGLDPQRRRNVIVTTSAIASNLPDLDFVPSLFTSDKLQYLLEHRGHTHTIVGTLLIALTVGAAFELWFHFRKWRVSSTDRVQLFGVTLLALLLHVGMDFTNNYGVHPFWPFYNGWLYGDSIFIWEPLLWTAAAPLVFLLRTKIARTLVGALLATALAVCFTSGLVPLAGSLLMTLLAGIMLLVGQRAAPKPALFSGIAMWIAITGLFAFNRSVAEAQIRDLIASRIPDTEVIDYVLTPMPADPLCWDVMLPMLDDEHYVIRHGSWSILPGVVSSAQCPGRALFNNITAPMTSISGLDSASVRWHGEITMPRDQIATLAREHCTVAEFMRFVRVPWSLRRDTSWIVGDLRYDREPGLGFAEIELKDGATVSCPRPAPWIPPRSDLLNVR